MPEPPTLDTFAPLIGSRFALWSDAAGESRELGLELVDAQPSADREPREPGGTPFALMFLGPRDPQLPAATYRLLHADLGRLDIELVPLGVDHRGTRYEALLG